MARKRTRKENLGLPKGWRFRFGAYRYQVPASQRSNWDGQTEFKLGATLPEAYRVWAERIEQQEEIINFGQLLDRYLLEVVPEKKPKTQRVDIPAIKRIRQVFGTAPLSAIKPAHVYKYRDVVGQKSKANANRDIALISHAYTKAVEWGLIDKNPIKGQVVKYGQKSRTRYVEDWELQEFMKITSPFIALYLTLKMLTGLRKSDLLAIKLTDITDEGISVIPRKTENSSGKHVIYRWTEELRETITRIRNQRGKVTSTWLFCTRRGQPYIKENGSTSGFDSIWQRMMRKALDETELAERFTEHDLRAKVASDTDLEHARLLLGHTDERTTERVYRRKGEVVEPTQWKSQK